MLLEALACIALALAIVVMALLVPPLYTRARVDLAAYREVRALERQVIDANLRSEYTEAQSFYPGPGDS